MTRLAALVLGAWIMLPAQPPAAPVVVHVWAENGSWQPAPALARDDFEVLVDGQPVTLQSVAPRDAGASIVVLLDATRSALWTPRPLAEELGMFASALGPADRLMLGAITDRVEFSPFRPAAHDIRSDVQRAVKDGGDRGLANSPIWDAIHEAVTTLAGAPPPRMILLLSDGRATGNRHGLVEVADYAMAHGVTINIVLNHRPQRIRQGHETAAIIQPNAPLEGLAAYTGGVLFFYPQFQQEQAQARFTHLASTVRALHAFTFIPPVSDGQPHRLEIRSTRPGVKVHAPLAFVAR